MFGTDQRSNHTVTAAITNNDYSRNCESLDGTQNSLR